MDRTFSTPTQNFSPTISAAGQAVTMPKLLIIPKNNRSPAAPAKNASRRKRKWRG
jgi:hypothetical protein